MRKMSEVGKISPKDLRDIRWSRMLQSKPLAILKAQQVMANQDLYRYVEPYGKTGSEERRYAFNSSDQLGVRLDVIFCDNIHTLTFCE